MQIDLAQLRLQSAPTRAKNFIGDNIVDYAIREIMDPMKSLGYSRKHAQGFIDAWKIKQIGQLKIEIYNDHKYADLLEYGWDDYDVYPLGKDAGGADVLKFFYRGKWIYAKHTHPKGFKGYHIVESAKNWGFIDKFLEKLIAAASVFLQENAIH